MKRHVIAMARPTLEQVRQYLDDRRDMPFTYAQVGASRAFPERPESLAGFDVDCHRELLGRGEEVFERAVEALRRWAMFDIGWVEACRPLPPADEGVVVGILARFLGLWFLCPARVVYRLAELGGEIERVGFAYGTLPGHVECGEERFLVEHHCDDDSVWYEVAAFSRPASKWLRAGYPCMRRLQDRFRRDSARAMLEAAHP